MATERTFTFAKLVRDETVPGYEQDPTILAMDWRTLSNEELRHELRRKLSEEAAEAAAADEGNDLAEELGDVIDIVEALMKVYDIDRDAVEASRQKKQQRRGGFEAGHYIQAITVEPGSYWETYCLRDGEKYPEVSDE